MMTIIHVRDNMRIKQYHFGAMQITYTYNNHAMYTSDNMYD